MLFYASPPLSVALDVSVSSLKDAGNFELSEYSSSVAFVNKKLLILLRIERPQEPVGRFLSFRLPFLFFLPKSVWCLQS
jgi:hypothetical protein